MMRVRGCQDNDRLSVKRGSSKGDHVQGDAGCCEELQPSETL